MGTQGKAHGVPAIILSHSAAVQYTVDLVQRLRRQWAPKQCLPWPRGLRPLSFSVYGLKTSPKAIPLGICVEGMAAPQQEEAALGLTWVLE